MLNPFPSQSPDSGGLPPRVVQQVVVDPRVNLLGGGEDSGVEKPTADGLADAGGRDSCHLGDRGRPGVLGDGDRPGMLGDRGRPGVLGTGVRLGCWGRGSVWDAGGRGSAWRTGGRPWMLGDGGKKRDWWFAYDVTGEAPVIGPLDDPDHDHDDDSP